MSSDPALDDTVPPAQVPSAKGHDMPDPADADNSNALLAELDVLLERMMALPVNHLDEEPVARPPRPQLPPADLPLITITEAMPGSIDTASLPPAVTSTSDDLYVQTLLREHHPEPEPTSEERPADRPEPGPALLPSRPPEPVALWSRPPSLPETSEQPAEPIVAPMLPLTEYEAEGPALSVAAPVWLQPLLWCNHSFDRLTTHLGAPGLWLQHPRGRTLLGWTGALLFAVACGLALGDCLHWTW